MVERAPQHGPRRDGTPQRRDGTTTRDVATFGVTMRKRVQGIVLGADPALTDGTPQQVGDHTVSITLSPAGEHGEVRTTFSIVGQDAVPFGEYSTISDEDGNITGDTTKLHGDVEGSRVTLTMSTRKGRGGNILVSVPNPDQVLPGRRHSMHVGEHDPAYIARVRKAFDIPQ